MNWFSLDELTSAVGADVDPIAGAHARSVGQSAVQAATRQRIEMVTDDAVILDGKGTPVVLLPEVPILGVTSVQLPDGVGGWADPMDPSGYTWSDHGALRRRATDVPVGPVGPGRPAWSRSSWVWSDRTTWPRHTDAWCWPEQLGGMLVIYDHGFPTIPPDLRVVALSIAARAYASPDGRPISQETIGGSTVQYAGMGTSGASAMEELIMRQYRMVVSA